MPYRCLFLSGMYLINSSVVHRMSVSGRSEASGANGEMLKVERGSTPELELNII